jgi:adenylate kinase family enzyme
MQRVMIIGPCGAGKSTLAFALSERLSLPLFHMDKLAWKPGWVDRSNDELRRILHPLVNGERWLIEGNYGSTLPDRLPYADTVIYLDYPVRLCLARLVRRLWHYRGRTRPDMTEGCPERLNLGFLWYVLRWNSQARPRIEARVAPYADKLVRLRNPREARAWFDRVPRG